MMGNVGEFLNNLVNFDKDNIHAAAVKAMDEYMKNPEFDPEFIKAKSSAAAGQLVQLSDVTRALDP